MTACLDYNVCARAYITYGICPYAVIDEGGLLIINDLGRDGIFGRF